MAGRNPTPTSELSLRGSRHARKKKLHIVPKPIKKIKCKVDFKTLPLDIMGYSPETSKGDCYFDESAAKEILEFFHNELVFFEGSKAGQTFALEMWQASIVANLFGWKRPDGTRRYREAFIFCGRKNGKTPLIAGILAYMAYKDDEPGAQLYSAAADHQQAALIYRHLFGMITKNPALMQKTKIYTSYKSMEFPEKDGVYRALSAEAYTKDGLNSSFIVVDELHAQPNRDLVDVLTTSTGTRKQPMIIHITTAGFDKNSICGEKYDYACKVRDGIINDPSFLPAIYEVLPEDNWADKKTWTKANPNLGVSISLDYLQREFQRAQDSPAYENTFRRLHLNQWTSSDTKFISTEKWNACGQWPVNEKDFIGRPCYAGLDLSTTTDISALNLIFPMADGGVATINYAWAPREGAEKRERKDRVPYITWARQGYMELTDGNVIDYDLIRRRINELGQKFEIKGIAYDRWNAQQICTQLEGDGVNMVMFGQGFHDMSAPTKEFEKLVISGKLRHGNNPLLNWAVSNVMVETDAAGNMKPSKKKSTERIDPVVAATMGIGLLIVQPPEAESVYMTRGVLMV